MYNGVNGTYTTVVIFGGICYGSVRNVDIQPNEHKNCHLNNNYVFIVSGIIIRSI